MAAVVLDCWKMARPPDPRLLSYLSSFDRHISSLALALREVVLEEAPEAIESLVKGYAVTIAFSFTGRPLKDGFCYVVAYGSKVNLGFNRGAQLLDPNSVLAGTGKLNRHITIQNESELNRPYVRRYIQAAIEQVGGRPQTASGSGRKTAPSRARNSGRR
jgi:hypothetical protein